MSIEENVIKHFKIIGLAGSEYAALIRDAAISGIQGGTIYDAVLLKAASKSGSEKIWTLNVNPALIQTGQKPPMGPAESASK